MMMFEGLLSTDSRKAVTKSNYREDFRSNLKEFEIPSPMRPKAFLREFLQQFLLEPMVYEQVY